MCVHNRTRLVITIGVRISLMDHISLPWLVPLHSHSHCLTRDCKLCSNIKQHRQDSNCSDFKAEKGRPGKRASPVYCQIYRYPMIRNAFNVGRRNRTDESKKEDFFFLPFFFFSSVSFSFTSSPSLGPFISLCFY